MRKGLTCVVVVGLGLFAAVLMGQRASEPVKTESSTAAARLATAERVCESLHGETGGAPKVHEGVEHTYLWSLRRMEAQLAVDAVRGDRVSAVERHAKWMREFGERVTELHKTGVISGFQLASTQFYVAEAEDLLARARAK